MTVDEMLARWDAGDTIWTVELGGLGPGYEQAIQIAAIEFARVCKDLPGIKKDDKDSTDRFRDKCRERLKQMDDDLGGLSGAQMGAAEWLAFQWCFVDGPDGVMARAKKKELDGEEDRSILVCRAWPKAPDATH